MSFLSECKVTGMESGSIRVMIDAIINKVVQVTLTVNENVSNVSIYIPLHLIERLLTTLCNYYFTPLFTHFLQRHFCIMTLKGPCMDISVQTVAICLTLKLSN